MEEKILSILKDVLNNSEVNTSSNQENCENWDSLNHLNLIVALEEAFEIEFEPEEIALMNSFSKIKEVLETKF